MELFLWRLYFSALSHIHILNDRNIEFLTVASLLLSTI